MLESSLLTDDVMSPDVGLCGHHESVNAVSVSGVGIGVYTVVEWRCRC